MLCSVHYCTILLAVHYTIKLSSAYLLVIAVLLLQVIAVPAAHRELLCSCCPRFKFWFLTIMPISATKFFCLQFLADLQKKGLHFFGINSIMFTKCNQCMTRFSFLRRNFSFNERSRVMNAFSFNLRTKLCSSYLFKLDH